MNQSKMEVESNVEAVNVVIEKLSELVAQNNALQQDSVQGASIASSNLVPDLDSSGQRETIDTAKHLIEFVRTENPALSFMRTPTKTPRSEDFTGHVTRSVVKQSQGRNERTDRTEEEIIVNLPANLGQLNLTNKKTLIESLMNLNASLQEKSEVSSMEKKGEKEATYKCTKCDYCSHNKYYLKQHVELVHNAERPFKCPFCDYAGKRSHSLKEHLVVHSTNRPYECSLCNATFRKKGHLTNHIKMHANAKNFECNICEDKFGDRYLLYDHLRSAHSPDSYYACDFCEYATTIKSNIIMHMHTHGNPKSYKCDKCPFIALHINIMKEHAVGHGVGTTFHEEAVAKKTKPVILLKCSECGFTTDEKSILNDHMLKHISDINLLTSAKSQEKNPHDTQTMTPATKGKEQPTAYVCKECDFMSAEAYAFMTHMLSHKAKQGPQMVTAASSKASTAAAAATSTTATSKPMTSPPSHPQKSVNEPVDLSQQWTHDSAVGLYRCTICGYFTKHQRTIKSHIWKHSGHKDIDYPMFQNGPLSVYDDIPIGKTTLVSNNNVIQMQKDQVDDAADNKDVKEEEQAKKSVAVRPSNIALAKDGGGTVPQAAGRGKRQSPIIEVTGAPVVGSPGTPKAVHITIPSLASQKVATSTAGSVPRSMATPTTVAHARDQSMHPVTTPRKPTIQIVDKSQKPKQPVTVLVSKQSSEQRQVILLTTASDREGQTAEGRFPGKIHKMVPVHRPVNPDEKRRTSTETPGSQNTNRPIVVIQRRNSTPAEESKQLITVVSSASGSDPGSVQSLATVKADEPASHSSYVTNVESNATNTVTSPKEEHTTSVEMTTDTSVDDTDSFELENTSREPNESKDGIVTKLRKRRLGSSPFGSDGESTEISATAPKRICIEKQDEEGNVVVEKLTPVFSAQPFAISESRGSSPRIPNSPRISEVAAQSDSSSESNPATPSAATEVTIVETQVMETVPEQSSVEIIQAECTDESQHDELQSGEPTVQYEEIVYVESGSEQVVEMSTAENTSAMSDQTSYESSEVQEQPLSPDHQQVVTLLSLLKKGPNYNPVCPPQANQSIESPRRRTRSLSKTEGNTAPKKGISSHLLAVIEQLREKTGSISGDEEESPEEEIPEPPSKASSRRSSAGGSRRGAGNKKSTSPETSVPIECYLYVETMEDDVGVKYRCKLCHYSSTSTSLMKTHMRLHKAKQPCECSLCEYVADSNESLQDHMLQHCKVRTYQCKMCPSVFNYKSQLRAHMRAHTFACDKCSFETSNPKTIQNHSKSHGKDFYCDHCSEAFTSEEALTNHVLICNSISIGELWKCKHCDFETENSEQQQEHLLSHAKIYKCETCEYTTQSYISIRNHCRDHEQEKTLKCELCDFIATSTRSLKSHMKRHANDQRFVQQPLEQYKCNLCGYVCHHLPSLKSHMWRHSSDSNYSYMITNDIINAAIDNPNLTDYAETGTVKQETPKENSVPNSALPDVAFQKSVGSLVTFRCCQCGFESSQKSQLNDHMKSHIDIIKKTFEVNKSQLLPGQIRRQVSGENEFMDDRAQRFSKDSTSDGDDNAEVHVIVPKSEST